MWSLSTMQRSSVVSIGVVAVGRVGVFSLGGVIAFLAMEAYEGRGGVILIEEGAVESVIVVNATSEGGESESIVGGEGVFYF